MSFYVTTGYDSHRLRRGKGFPVGGFFLPSHLSSVAHSDGDALLHALTDSVLSLPEAPGDIGQLFPNTDEQWRAQDSRFFLQKALSEAFAQKYRIVNIDAVVLLEKPKLSPFKDEILSSLTALMPSAKGHISLKGKTGEHIGLVGHSKIWHAWCTVLWEEK